MKNKKSKDKEKEAKQTKKRQKVNDNDDLNLDYYENDSIKFEEQEIALKKKLQILSKEASVRKAIAEAEALELANLAKRKELGL